MKCVLYDDAGTFGHRIEDFLAAREIENNLILGVWGGLLGRAESGAVMLAVEDGDQVRLAAMMTPPYRLIVSKGDPEAIPVLIDGIGCRGIELPGVVGLIDMSEAFAREWRATTRQKIAPATEMTLYALEKVIMPAPVAGEFRQAEEGDFDRVAAWVGQFGEELSLPAESTRRWEVAEEKMKRRAVFFWDVSSAPVSMASYSGATGNGVRVNLVYTPPAERRKGYASACVAHMSRHLLDSGRKWCAIFADVNNPTSNSIYRRMGYKEAATYREYDFTPAGAAR
jgi:hypothetical protein